MKGWPRLRPVAAVGCLAWFASASCNGLLGIEEGHPRDGGATDASASGDAETVDALGTGETGASCDPSLPFRIFEDVPLPTRDIGSAGLTPDERAVYFSTTAGKLWVARRSERTSAFGPPQALDATYIGAVAYEPYVAPNELALFVAVGNSVVTVQLYSRTNVDAAFRDRDPLTNVNYGIGRHPYLVPGRALYFYYTTLGNGAGIRVSRVAQDGGFELSQAVPAPPLDAFVVTSDELTIYASQNTQAPAHCFRARREKSDDPFGAEEVMPEFVIHSSETMSPTWLSTDGCSLYFVHGRNVDGGFGNDLRVARKR
jgi:hypothetical protein